MVARLDGRVGGCPGVYCVAYQGPKSMGLLARHDQGFVGVAGGALLAMFSAYFLWWMSGFGQP
jgi:hypothetical protein